MVAVAKTVIETKEELMVLYPTKEGMIAKILFYQEELQPIPAVNKTAVSKEELTMTKTLINSMTSPFEPQKYHDEYQEKLREAIQSKIQGQDIVVADNGSQNTIFDLMTALQQSINMSQNNSIPS